MSRERRVHGLPVGREGVVHPAHILGDQPVPQPGVPVLRVLGKPPVHQPELAFHVPVTVDPLRHRQVRVAPAGPRQHDLRPVDRHPGVAQHHPARQVGEAAGFPGGHEDVVGLRPRGDHLPPEPDDLGPAGSGEVGRRVQVRLHEPEIRRRVHGRGALRHPRSAPPVDHTEGRGVPAVPFPHLGRQHVLGLAVAVQVRGQPGRLVVPEGASRQVVQRLLKGTLPLVERPGDALLPLFPGGQSLDPVQGDVDLRVRSVVGHGDRQLRGCGTAGRQEQDR